MTPEQIEAEHVKAMASAAYSELTILRRSANSIEQIVARHWDHPAFQRYMTDMGLTDAFNEFRKRGKR